MGDASKACTLSSAERVSRLGYMGRFYGLLRFGKVRTGISRLGLSGTGIDFLGTAVFCPIIMYLAARAREAVILKRG